MPTNRKPFDPDRLPPHPYAWHVARWTANLLADHREARHQFHVHLLLEPDAAQLCDLLGLEATREELEDQGEFRERLKAHLREIRRAGRPVVKPPFERNLRRIRRLVGLEETEMTLLMFLAAYHTQPVLEQAVDSIGKLTTSRLPRFLSEVLELPLREVQQALGSRSALVETGLVRHSRRHSGTLDVILHFHEEICEILFQEEPDEHKLFSTIFHPAAPPQLRYCNYAYLGNERELVRAWLERALERRLPGVNILIHGRPGTGKTQFALALARKLKAALDEVATTDDNDEPIPQGKRLTNYRLAQRVLSRSRRRLLLFDEVEELFPDYSLGPFFGNLEDQPGKGWFNRMLEENPVPTLWISNRIGHIDPAILRRFDLVLEFRAPPREERARMFRRQLKTLPVSGKWVERVAGNRSLTPGLLAQAERIVRELEPQSREQAEALLEQVLRLNLGAAGQDLESASSSKQEKEKALPPYDPSLLNADTNLRALLEGLRHHPEARICLYGPPGTGKTAFGHYLAGQLGMPLHAVRTSDLLDPWVGGTERNIARMFHEARKASAVLLLDEADSFLRDRTSAVRSWEVTQVNELLTRMESFEGIFICSTNLMESLDQASLRRFDFKIHLDYLKPEAAWKLFRRTLAARGKCPSNKSHWKRALARLGPLTPGDFATVSRRARFQPDFLSPKWLLEELAKEVSCRDRSGRRGIGFLAEIA